ncbi:MAG: response regulator [Flavisolibacter sp.]
MNKITLVVCDEDMDELNRIRQFMENRKEFELEIIYDASELVNEAKRRQPCIVLVNPEMKAFNEYDVCKKLMKDAHIPVMLLVSPDSTHRDFIEDCTADDVVTKPVEVDNLLNLVMKHMTVHQH